VGRRYIDLACVSDHVVNHQERKQVACKIRMYLFVMGLGLCEWMRTHVILTQIA
jgi:hypothetical protein